MNSHSNEVIHIRIMVRGWNEQTASYNFVRGERVAFSPPHGIKFRLFNYRLKEYVTYSIFLQNWKDHTYERIWMLSIEDISKCLDHMYINFDARQIIR